MAWEYVKTSNSLSESLTTYKTENTLPVTSYDGGSEWVNIDATSMQQSDFVQR